MKQKNWFLVLAIFLMLPFVSCQKDNSDKTEDSDIEKLCSGTWYATFVDSGTSVSIEFTFRNNGSFKYYFNYYDDDYDEDASGSGSYTLSGDILKMTLNGQTEQMTVIRLTDKELILEDMYSERIKFVH
jgi:uncharacterized protein (TIGR03066 family)